MADTLFSALVLLPHRHLFAPGCDRKILHTIQIHTQKHCYCFMKYSLGVRTGCGIVAEAAGTKEIPTGN